MKTNTQGSIDISLVLSIGILIIISIYSYFYTSYREETQAYSANVVEEQVAIEETQEEQIMTLSGKQYIEDVGFSLIIK